MGGCPHVQFELLERAKRPDDGQQLNHHLQVVYESAMVARPGLAEIYRGITQLQRLQTFPHLWISHGMLMCLPSNITIDDLAIDITNACDAIVAAKKDIIALQTDLEEEKTIRKQKEEYQKLTAEILKLPSRQATTRLQMSFLTLYRCLHRFFYQGNGLPAERNCGVARGRTCNQSAFRGKKEALFPPVSFYGSRAGTHNK